MGKRKQILFVINPISGGKRKTSFKKQVLDVLDLQSLILLFRRHPMPIMRTKLVCELLKKSTMQ
ncbi:hypothetical protein [Sphingobacterium sp. IITKGP-BTPF85]|uniref:hypothetical protein n=1 Tax=Sphingobacterium sp. IITKGP-BTPF85 TaxID=1338009 RepID=UPI00038A42A7|nr:hypothetical protein [Sphingobacterium sp. IITKGP-BTPF85]KKX50351.1 hypothetical protein L950_0210990 [Sphingobacterium sp. IITKGP-BTPF85]